jgi:hypothetical protein
VTDALYLFLTRSSQHAAISSLLLTVVVAAFESDWLSLATALLHFAVWQATLFP